MLAQVMQLIKNKGMKIINVDAVIVAERPKMAPYIPQMKRTLASYLEISENKIGLKAKTNEKLGEVGRLKAIACWAVCLLSEEPSP